MEIPLIPANTAISQPFVLGTNTFSQAQQKIRQINQGPDEVSVPSAEISPFIPHQILHPPQPGPVPSKYSYYSKQNF